MRDLYNQLPKDTQKRYNIIYSEWRNNSVTTFRSENKKWGAILNDTDLLVEAIYDSIYFDIDHNIFKCVNFEPAGYSYWYRNLQGKIIDALSGCEVTQDEHGNTFFRRAPEKEWGLMDEQFNVVIQPRYEVIQSLSKNIFKAKQNGLWGLIDIQQRVVFPFQASEIFSIMQDGIVLAQMNGQYFKLSEDGTYELTPFTHVFRPRSNSYWWSYEKGKNRLKALIDGTERPEDEDLNPFDEITEYSGKWGVINEQGGVLIPPDYDYIDFFGLTPTYKVFVGKMTLSLDNFHTVALSETKCGVVDLNNKVIIPVIYEWIVEISENLWAVNKGGQVFFDNAYQVDHWSVRNGRWGVVNEHGEVIVPVEYGSIMLTWHRIKDLIIVQRDTRSFDGTWPYEAYDLKGKKVVPTPDYKAHIFYKG